METIMKQDRIALKSLKVAQFASEETLCFTATVLFDGIAIAQARNNGRGGATFLHALEGKAAQLSEAVQFAKGRHAARFEGGISGKADAPLPINQNLAVSLAQLADTHHHNPN